MKKEKLKTAVISLVFILLWPHIAYADVVTTPEALGVTPLIIIGAVIVGIALITFIALKLFKGKNDVGKFH